MYTLHLILYEIVNWQIWNSCQVSLGNAIAFALHRNYVFLQWNGWFEKWYDQCNQLLGSINKEYLYICTPPTLKLYPSYANNEVTMNCMEWTKPRWEIKNTSVIYNSYQLKETHYCLQYTNLSTYKQEHITYNPITRVVQDMYSTLSPLLLNLS